MATAISYEAHNAIPGPSILPHPVMSGDVRRPRSPRTRFFPPPFRIDQDDIALPALHSGIDGHSSSRGSTAEVGSSSDHSRRSSPTKPVKKKRKLLFTSQLPPPSPSNPDGTPSVSHMRYQSTIRLKQKWDSIYERFRDAHLTEQDEIYLGRGKEKIRLLKDNGVIRGLKEEMTFGSFHIKEEDLDDVEKELRRAAGEDVDSGDYMSSREKERLAQQQREGQQLQQVQPTAVVSLIDSDEDELGAWDPDFVRTQYPELSQQVKRSASVKPGDGGDAEAHRDSDGLSDSENDDEQEEADPSTLDPDLRAFLEAEARRKEIMGDEDDDGESDDGESIVDFRSAEWNRIRWTGASSSEDDSSSDEEDSDEEEEDDNPSHSTPSRRKNNIGPATLQLARPGIYDSSDDEIDVLDVERRRHREPQQQSHSLSSTSTTVSTRDDYRLAMEAKRENVEQALQAMSLGHSEVLPYDDIPGLAALLGLPEPAPKPISVTGVPVATTAEDQPMSPSLAMMDLPSSQRSRESEDRDDCEAVEAGLFDDDLGVDAEVKIEDNEEVEVRDLDGVQAMGIGMDGDASSMSPINTPTPPLRYSSAFGAFDGVQHFEVEVTSQISPPPPQRGDGVCTAAG